MKTLATFTGTRAEFGLLKDMLERFRNAPDVTSHLIVSGAHLSSGFGDTSSEITDRFYDHVHQIPMDGVGGDEEAIVAGLGGLSSGMSQVLKQVRPNAIILLGDRYELLPVASAALIFNVPIIHLSGGDITLGAIDNKIRHALSKMADLHLVTNESAYRQLLRMDVPETDIHIVGIPRDIANAVSQGRAKDTLAELGVTQRDKLVLSTFHPETLVPWTFENLQTYCQALSTLADGSVCIILTGANGDKDGNRFNAYLREFAEPDRGLYFFESLGIERYHLLLRAADLVMGNSSSGLTEAPSFRTPTLDVGDRQTGRVRGSSVFHVDVDARDIVEKSREILTDATYIEFDNPYEKEDSVDRIFTRIMDTIRAS